ncbi:MAG TPA: hypothetical protein VM840_05370 [Actinomycetota bacterium]|nr:hypothetical protein [Actinomycetota bacterium]
MRRISLTLALAALLAGVAPPASGHEKGSAGARERFGRVVRVFEARGHTASARGSSSTCPAAATCGEYRVGRARWAVDGSGVAAMNYRYNDAGRPSRAPDAATVHAAVRASAAEWNRVNPATRFVDAGTTTARPGALGSDGTCDDGVNSVGWRPMSTGTIGLTYICYDRRTYRIVDIDTALNASLGWASFSAASPTASSYDVRSIVTHELGHWLSLFDLRTSRSRGLTMYASAGPGEINKRTLGLGDALGSHAAYPCGTRCVRSGLVSD